MSNRPITLSVVVVVALAASCAFSLISPFAFASFFAVRDAATEYVRGAESPLPPALDAPAISGAFGGGRFVTSLDLAVAPDGRAHAVWIEETGRPFTGEPRPQRLVAAGTGPDGAWGAPVAIAEGGGLGPARVVAAADGLHVVFGGALRHAVSTDGGVRWSETAPFAAEGPEAPSVESFDVAEIDGALVVAYAAADSTLRYDSGYRTDYDSTVRVIRRPARGAETRAVAFTEPFVAGQHQQRVVRLATGAGRACLITGAEGGSLSFAESRDGGATWSAAVSAPPPAPPPPPPGQSPPAFSMPLDRTRFEVRPDRVVAVFASRSLFVAGTADGASWSPAVEVYKSPRRGTDISSVRSCDGSSLVVWTEESPPEGMHILTYPYRDGSNLCVCDLARILDAAGGAGGPVVPGTLVTPPKLAMLAVARSGPASTVVCWAGGEIDPHVPGSSDPRSRPAEGVFVASLPPAPGARP